MLLLKIQTVVIRLASRIEEILHGAQNEPICSEKEENCTGHRLYCGVTCFVEISLLHLTCFNELCLWENAKCIDTNLNFMPISL